MFEKKMYLVFAIPNSDIIYLMDLPIDNGCYIVFGTIKYLDLDYIFNSTI